MKKKCSLGACSRTGALVDPQLVGLDACSGVLMNDSTSVCLCVEGKLVCLVPVEMEES